MTAPGQDQLNVELAKFGGVNLKSSSQLVAYIAMLGTFLSGLYGHDWGITKNAQTLAYLCFAIITAAHLLSRAIHHSAVEHHNAAVKVATISAAVSQGHQVEAASPTQLVGPSDVVVEPSLPNQPVDATTDVAAGVPVETVAAQDVAATPVV